MLTLKRLPSSYNARKRRLPIWVFFLASLAGLYACVSGKQAGSQVPGTDQPVRGTTQAPPADEPNGGVENVYATDGPIIAKGQQLFENNCSACHNFRQKGIGPGLGAVTSEVSSAWLGRFIRNAPEVIQSGDERAVRLFEAYNQYMPPFPALSDADLQAVLAYIHANQSRPVATRDENQEAYLPDPIPAKITQSGLVLSLEEITQAPASAEKVPLARINKMLVLPGKKDRVFIEDLRGSLYELVDNKLRVFMDMRNERPGFIHAPGLATGFGSYAFHPGFYKNGLFYTTHTEAANAAPADFAYADSIKVTLQWVLTEWKMKDPAAMVFSGTGREMLRVNVVSPIHGVQEITFNPLAKPGTPEYGLLYVGVGDGGATENGYHFLCHDRSRVWGTVLRIDPRGTNSQNGRYGIPAVNPFAKDKDPAMLGEIFCRGFRNPNRIGWAPDGTMLIADIGHANAEELNVGVAGADYGWPEREGTFRMNHRGKMDRVYALPENDSALAYTYPVAQYDHGEGKAISGGFVYSGTTVPLLKGKYIFGDIVSGRVFCAESTRLKPGQQALIEELDIRIAGKTTTFQEACGSKKTDLRFGVGLENELYLYTKADGRIYKVSGGSLNQPIGIPK
ncbi:MAG: PQQ-dependent sugar dehydrogenase [Ferruginibacter sp.]|nr:PQQ-dependent sugar dehydrogenase [Cytophagales bacterium]